MILRRTAMKVTFKKIPEKGYSVTIEGRGIMSSTMSPAPGYHPRLPHDAAHFIVEQELKIRGGVFGQLASGGSFNRLHSVDDKIIRKAKKRRAHLAHENKADALFAEHAIYAAQSRWEHQAIIPQTSIPPETIDRICRSFEEFAGRWSQLPVGGSIELEWGLDALRTRKR